MTKRRVTKRWESRLRRMGLPSDHARYAPRWSAALEVAEAVQALNQSMEKYFFRDPASRVSARLAGPPEPTSLAEMYLDALDRADEGSGWRSTPSPFESPWRVGAGYAQIDPDAHINNLVILKHPLDRDEGDSELPLTTPRKPSTFGE